MGNSHAKPKPKISTKQIRPQMINKNAYILPIDLSRIQDKKFNKFIQLVINYINRFQYTLCETVKLNTQQKDALYEFIIDQAEQMCKLNQGTVETFENDQIEQPLDLDSVPDIRKDAPVSILKDKLALNNKTEQTLDLDDNQTKQELDFDVLDRSTRSKAPASTKSKAPPPTKPKALMSTKSKAPVSKELHEIMRAAFAYSRSLCKDGKLKDRKQLKILLDDILSALCSLSQRDQNNAMYEKLSSDNLRPYFGKIFKKYS